MNPLTVAIIAILMIFMALAHIMICAQLANQQCAEAIKVMLKLQLAAIDAQDFNRANRLAWEIFAVEPEQHYRDLLFFRNPWNRYSVDVRVQLGQE